MLEAALGDALADEGWGEGEWQLDSIASIEPVAPRFEGSRMYEGLAFGLLAKLLMPIATPEPTTTPEPAATPEAESVPSEAAEALAAALIGETLPTAPDETLPAPTEAPREWVLSEKIYTVTLDVYGQVKPGLSLGLNGSDCELVSVETEADDAGTIQRFTIAMRRFGHGVGMSQRGAQWMAGHYGMNWQQIAGFYYPGLSFERMVWPKSALTDLEALPDGVGAARPKPTPAPTPAPLPELEEGEYYAVVTASMLNVRQQPSTASMAISQLAGGRRVIVRGDEDENGWVSIRTAELEGFVKAEYLKRE